MARDTTNEGAPVDREDDVEGHRSHARAPEGVSHLPELEGVSSRRRITGDEDDVEGHSYGRGGTRGE